MNTSFKHITLVVSTLVLMALGGCVTTQPDTVVKVQYKVVKIDDELFTTKPMTLPPPKDAYVAATKDDRITMLLDYARGLQTDVGAAWARIKEIKDLQDKNVKTVEEGTTK